eukprot:5587608-Prymnesium_polylepis.1
MLRWEPWRLGGFPRFTPHYPTPYPTPYPAPYPTLSPLPPPGVGAQWLRPLAQRRQPPLGSAHPAQYTCGCGL